MKFKRFFLLLGILFLIQLAYSLTTRSNQRVSLVGLSGETTQSQVSIEGGEDSESESRFHIQDFHRVNLRDGTPFWEIKAKDAKHYSEQGVTHVNDATLTLFRKGEPPIHISSNSARLSLSGEDLSGAELEGNIRVLLEPTTKVRADNAFFNAAERKITSASEVEIEGEGYFLRGNGMDMNLDSQVIILRSAVESRFEAGADVPSPLT